MHRRLESACERGLGPEARGDSRFSVQAIRGSMLQLTVHHAAAPHLSHSSTQTGPAPGPRAVMKLILPGSQLCALLVAMGSKFPPSLCSARQANLEPSRRSQPQSISDNVR